VKVFKEEYMKLSPLNVTNTVSLTKGFLTLAPSLALLIGASTAHAAWPEKVDFFGQVIFEAGYVSGVDYNSDVSSFDMTVYYLLLGMEAELSDQVSATVSLLHEEDQTDFGLDEGFITLKPNDDFNFQLGQLYLPFGQFNSLMVNYSYTYQIARSLETAAVANYDNELMSASAYIFNGNVREDAEQSADSYGFRFGLGEDTMHMNVDYISNIGDSDAFSGDASGLNANEQLVGDLSDAMAVSGHAMFDQLSFDFEYFTALDDITTATAQFIQPSTLMLEANYFIDNGCECRVGLGVHQAEETQGLLPETRFSIGYTQPLLELISMNVELFHDLDYDTNEGGTGDSSTGFFVDLIASF